VVGKTPKPAEKPKELGPIELHEVPTSGASSEPIEPISGVTGSGGSLLEYWKAKLRLAMKRRRKEKDKGPDKDKGPGKDRK